MREAVPEKNCARFDNGAADRIEVVETVQLWTLSIGFLFNFTPCCQVLGTLPCCSCLGVDSFRARCPVLPVNVGIVSQHLIDRLWRPLAIAFMTALEGTATSEATLFWLLGYLMPPSAKLPLRWPGCRRKLSSAHHCIIWEGRRQVVADNGWTALCWIPSDQVWCRQGWLFSSCNALLKAIPAGQPIAFSLRKRASLGLAGDRG